MYILLTNDDGVDAPGLLALKQSLEKIAPVIVLAPDHNWSAAGHTKTLSKPLRVWQKSLRDGSSAFVTDGAPTDCVALVMLGVLPEKPAMIVSGINPGSNLAHDLTYSGTVAAAMEGAINNLPALAVSLDANHRDDIDFAPAAEYAQRIASRLLETSAPTRKNGTSDLSRSKRRSKGLQVSATHSFRAGALQLPPDTFLNVNVPDVPLAQIRGVRVTRLGKRIYRDALVEREDPSGKKYYWIGGEPPSGVVEEGTDVGAIAQNFVSITPVHMDMTSHALLDPLRNWEKESWR